jgi:hypothetical protein
MADSNSNLSIISLCINGLNAPIKRQNARMNQKPAHKHILSIRNSFSIYE